MWITGTIRSAALCTPSSEEVRSSESPQLGRRLNAHLASERKADTRVQKRAERMASFHATAGDTEGRSMTRPWLVQMFPWRFRRRLVMSVK